LVGPPFTRNPPPGALAYGRRRRAEGQNQPVPFAPSGVQTAFSGANGTNKDRTTDKGNWWSWSSSRWCPFLASDPTWRRLLRRPPVRRRRWLPAGWTSNFDLVVPQTVKSYGHESDGLAIRLRPRAHGAGAVVFGGLRPYQPQATGNQDKFSANLVSQYDIRLMTVSARRTS